jgi:signal transduction histidine kinase
MTAPRTQRDAPSPRRAQRDAIMAAAVVLMGGALCVMLDTAERLAAPVLRWEFLQLDDLLLTSCLAICASSWFAVRRWHDARRALLAEQASEREKAEYVTKLEALSAQLLQTEQAERTRIGELLHDEVGQTLYACRLQLERAQNRTRDPQLTALLAEAYSLAGDAMASTRELTARMSPPVLHDLGLAEAVEWLLSRTEQRFGVQTRFVADLAWQRIDQSMHEPVFQSVSELVANAVKHARASLLEVTAQEHGAVIEVRVSDDGRGFAHSTESVQGFGLLSIERRMARIGARLQIDSRAERGTSAVLQLPAAS